jgi:hypothetical protein
MHVLLNDEETMLADSVFGQAVELGATGTEALQHHDDRRLWQGLATSDVLSLGLSEDFGGFGTLTDAAMLPWRLGALSRQYLTLVAPSCLPNSSPAQGEAWVSSTICSREPGALLLALIPIQMN